MCCRKSGGCGGPCAWDEVKLIDLTPVGAEYGLLKDPQHVTEAEGPGKMDLGPFAI